MPPVLVCQQAYTTTMICRGLSQGGFALVLDVESSSRQPEMFLYQEHIVHRSTSNKSQGLYEVMLQAQ